MLKIFDMAIANLYLIDPHHNPFLAKFYSGLVFVTCPWFFMAYLHATAKAHLPTSLTVALALILSACFTGLTVSSNAESVLLL